MLAPVLPPEANIEFAHFNALRGRDIWKGLDEVVTVGREEPPPITINRLARAIFSSDPEPLDFAGQGKYPLVPMGYRLRDGSQKGVETPIHPDPRAQCILELIREREIIQAVDRLRLIHSPKQKRVVILGSIPLDITVDERRTLDELAGTPGRLGPRERLRQVYERHGILPLSKRDLPEIAPDLFSNEESAKSVLRDARRAAEKGGENEIESLFGIRPLFRTARYRIADQRGHDSRVVYDPDRHADPATALAALIGVTDIKWVPDDGDDP